MTRWYTIRQTCCVCVRIKNVKCRRRRARADADISPVRIERQGVVDRSRADKRGLDGAKRGGDGAVDGLIELGVLRAGIRQGQRDYVGAYAL